VTVLRTQWHSHHIIGDLLLRIRISGGMKPMMYIRSQITLDFEMRRRAKLRAADLGISFAEYVRQLVAKDLGPPNPKPDISIIFDLVDEGPVTDIARDKDKMVGEAVWEEYLRDVGRNPRQRSRTRIGRRKRGRRAQPAKIRTGN
jgi:hypothetical protein